MSADGEDIKPGMRPSAVTMFAGMAAVTVALILLVIGVLSPTWYWFALWCIAVVQIAVLLNQARIAEMQLDALMTMVSRSLVHAVRCAGCRRAAVLANAPSAEDDTVRLPPGWQIVDERPYCEVCMAKGN